MVLKPILQQARAVALEKVREITAGRDYHPAFVQGMIISFIVAAVMMLIGGYILFSVQSSMPAVSSTSPWFNTLDNLTTTIQTAYGMFPVVLVIIAAVVIISVLFYLWNPGGRQM